MTHVVFSTGAGISAPSGLGTYRGPEGLWTLHPELEAISTGKHYAKNLDVMEPFWNDFRNKCIQAHPNAAHLAIADLQQAMLHNGQRSTVITQNVDNLHELACVSQADDINSYLAMCDQIIKLHGNICLERCLAADIPGRGCSNKESWHFMAFDKCPTCNGPARPDVVFFEEKLPEKAWNKAQSACLTATHFIAVGTSGQVVPACDLVSVAKAAGAKTFLINAEEWEFPHPDFDETLIGDCTVLLPQVIEGIDG